jgi:hypothetical protein
VRGTRGPVPVAVSRDGLWVYYFNAATLRPGTCAGNGFTEPGLWRVSTAGGRPRRAGISTTGIAFSPDGRIVAYTCTRPCGRTTWIVIHYWRTGTTPRILPARNAPTSANPIFDAELS